MSRESKIAVLQSILVRVQCRANEPRAPHLAAAAAPAPAPRANESPVPLEVAPVFAPVAAPMARRPIVREERESIPPWPEPEPEPELPPELIPIDDSAPQLIPIEEPLPELIPIDDSAPQLEIVEEEEEPAPPSAPRFREEIVGQDAVSAASPEEEFEDPITLPPVSGRQPTDGSLADVVTLPPGSEPPREVLKIDIAGDGESAPPPPAAEMQMPSGPIELVESAEPPPVELAAPPRVEAPAPRVRLMVDPVPSAPDQPRPAPVVVEVRATAIGPADRAAAHVVAFEGEAKRFAPTSFGELLDATLGLGRD